MAMNPYESLGVQPDCDTETIRKTYKKLARQFHPDLNPGDAAAEERFKEISAAYEVLGDPEKRSNYDEFGAPALEASFDAEQARKAKEEFEARFGSARRTGFEGDYQFGDIDDMLSGLFGARSDRQEIRLRGHDIEAELWLDFLAAIRGTEQRLSLRRPTPDGRVESDSVSVRIPPGVRDGGRLRIPGKGAPGLGGGPSGDLWARVRVRPHRFFRREGNDLTLDAPISVREALLGGPIEIPTVEGRAKVSVPPGSSSGRALRLRGKGVPDPSGGPRGDLLVRLQIHVPKHIDDATRAALEPLESLDDPDLRKELLS